jgi:hypothetical protein
VCRQNNADDAFLAGVVRTGCTPILPNPNSEPTVVSCPVLQCDDLCQIAYNPPFITHVSPRSGETVLSHAPTC